MHLMRLLILSMGAIGLLARTPVCRAQPGAGLPTEITTSASLSEEQKSRIREFVDQFKAGLSSDALEIRRSRNALLEPLRNDSASVTFRLEYAGDLEPVLRPLIASDKPIVAVNAVRIAGELATPKGIDLLEPAISDKRPAVRFEAVIGFAHTFQATERSSPAIAAGQAISALQTLKAGLLHEDDWHVVEGYVQAFKAGSRVPFSKLSGVRAASVMALAEGLGAKAQNANDPPKEVPSPMYSAFQRAAQTMRNALTNQNINEPQPSDAELKAAGALGGDLLANLRRRVLAGELKNGASRSEFTLIAADSERSVFLATSALRGSTDGLDLHLGEKIQQGKDDVFVNDSLRLIGANGILTGNPFNFADDRFVK
jgi:hypothetical protein